MQAKSFLNLFTTDLVMLSTGLAVNHLLLFLPFCYFQMDSRKSIFFLTLLSSYQSQIPSLLMVKEKCW